MVVKRGTAIASVSELSAFLFPPPLTTAPLDDPVLLLSGLGLVDDEPNPPTLMMAPPRPVLDGARAGPEYTDPETVVTSPGVSVWLP
jgi:hypothetical protein